MRLYFFLNLKWFLSVASYKNDNANKKIKIQKQTTVSGCCCPLLNLGPRDIIIQIFGLSYINAQYFGEMKPDNTQNKSLKLNCLYIYVLFMPTESLLNILNYTLFQVIVYCTFGWFLVKKKNTHICKRIEFLISGRENIQAIFILPLSFFTLRNAQETYFFLRFGSRTEYRAQFSLLSFRYFQIFCSTFLAVYLNLIS